MSVCVRDSKVRSFKFVECCLLVDRGRSRNKIKLWTNLDKQITDETNMLSIKVIKMPQIMDVWQFALQAREYGIYPISSKGWQIAYTCMTVFQDMNGLEGGPTTVVTSRLGHAYVYVFIPHMLQTKRVQRWGGSSFFVCTLASTNGCGHWVWYVWRLFIWVRAAGLCGSLKPRSVNEQWGGQSDRQWSEISRWKPWGWLVGERLIHQSLQTAFVTFDAKLMKTAHWWLKNL